jgi:hypothetical protein
MTALAICTMLDEAPAGLDEALLETGGMSQAHLNQLR